MPHRPIDRREWYVRATQRILDKINTCTQMPFPSGVHPDLEWQYFIEINDLVTELIECQTKTGVEFGPPKNTKSKSIPLSDRLSKLKKWLHSNGVSKSIPLDFRTNLKEGIGAVANRNIKQNEELLRIPRSICMTTSTAANSQALKPLIQSPPPKVMTSFMIMVIHLISEKTNVSSKFRAYIDCLPSIHALPIYFHPNDMYELKQLHSSIVRDLANNLRDLVRAYANLFQIVNQLNIVSIWAFTYTEFRWAVGTLFTRQNLIPGYCQSELNGQWSTGQELPQRILALIPGWDLINHKEGLSITSTNNFDDGDQVFVAPEDVQTGDQVYMAYTEERTNRSRFMRTGFLTPNPVQNDSLSFPNIKQLNRRKQLAYSLFELREPFQLAISIPLSKNYDNIIGTLICAFGTDTDLDKLDQLECIPQDQNLDRNAKLIPVNKNMDTIMTWYRSNEIGCMNKIIKYVETQALIKLSKYSEPCTLQEDIDKIEEAISVERQSASEEEMVKLMFRKNVLSYLQLEKVYAQHILDYLHESQESIDHSN